MILYRYIAATAIVLACSVTESNAQQHQHGQYRGTVVNRTVVNNTNVYNGGGYGYGYRGGYNNVGMWPGSGPYDSAIAVAGIVAGASVLNNVISSRQPSTQVVVQQAPQVVVQPVPVYQAPAYQSGPGCITAMASDGNYYRYCR